MWWMLAASAAQGLLQTRAAREQAKAYNIVNSAQRDADKLLNAGQNQLAAAQASLQHTVRTLNNQRQLKAQGDQFNASQTNLSRITDDFSRGGLSRQIAASEELGALAAQAGAAGVGGASIDMIRDTTKLKAAILEQQVSTSQGLTQYDAQMQMASMQAGMFENLDLSPITANMNYVLPVRQDKMVPNYVAGALNSMMGVAPQVLSNMSWGNTDPGQNLNSVGAWGGNQSKPRMTSADSAGMGFTTPNKSYGSGSKFSI